MVVNGDGGGSCDLVAMVVLAVVGDGIVFGLSVTVAVMEVGFWLFPCYC